MLLVELAPLSVKNCWSVFILTTLPMICLINFFWSKNGIAVKHFITPCTLGKKVKFGQWYFPGAMGDTLFDNLSANNPNGPR